MPNSDYMKIFKLFIVGIGGLGDAGDAAFDSYLGGVHDDNKVSWLEEIDHTIGAVGHTFINNFPYSRVQNSHGTDWDVYGRSAHLIAEEAYVPILKRVESFLKAGVYSSEFYKSNVSVERYRMWEIDDENYDPIKFPPHLMDKLFKLGLFPRRRSLIKNKGNNRGILKEICQIQIT